MIEIRHRPLAWPVGGGWNKLLGSWRFDMASPMRYQGDAKDAQ